MKTPRSLLIIVALLAPSTLLMTNGCSKAENDKVADAAQDTKSAVKDAAVDVKDAAVDTWDSIKGYTYEKRADFSASMDRMAAKKDAKIADLKAKYSSTPDSSKETAMKEYEEARASLKARLSELGDATADTWAEAKAKAEKAWDKVDDAYDRATK